MITTGAKPESKMLERLIVATEGDIEQARRLHKAQDYAGVREAAQQGKVENIRSMAGEKWLREQEAIWEKSQAE